MKRFSAAGSMKYKELGLKTSLNENDYRRLISGRIYLFEKTSSHSG